MIKRFITKGQTLAFLSVFKTEDNVYDKAFVNKHPLEEEDPNETGFQRLKNLFKPYSDHPYHPRIINLYQTSIVSFFMGGIYGGCTKSRDTFIKFIETNEATQFRSHYDAKRQLSDKMFLSFMRGFTRWGLRVSFFCTTFVSTYTILSVYRNNDSIFYYTIGGLMSGALYKLPLGPKGMIAGGFFGSCFGSLYGGLKFLELLLMNKTEEDLRIIQFTKHEKETIELKRELHKVSLKDNKEELENLVKSIK